VGGGERKEKNKKRKGNKEIAWERKEKKKKIERCFLVLRWASGFFMGKKGFLIGNKTTPS
jgi:hypothetical protein